MRHRLVFGGAVGAIVLLAGCAELPAGQADACTIHAAWVSSGSPADDESRVMRTVEVAIRDSPDGAVATAADRLISAIDAGDPVDVAVASAQFAETCSDEGWQPPEG